MKIIYRSGDALEAPELVVAHGCNTLGVMGAGIALAVKNKYPKAYQYYAASKPLFLGQVQLVPIDNRRTIANCMTQGHDRGGILGVDYMALGNCLWKLNRRLCHVVPAVAMPRIGAGLGGGDWNKIVDIIEAELTFVQPVVYVQ